MNVEVINKLGVRKYLIFSEKMQNTENNNIINDFREKNAFGNCHKCSTESLWVIFEHDSPL